MNRATSLGILLLAALLLPCTLHARLGETVAWCDAHYGPDHTADPKCSAVLTSRVYVKDGLKISAYFLHGKVVKMNYEPTKKGGNLGGQVEALIHDNAAGMAWELNRTFEDGATLYVRMDRSTAWDAGGHRWLSVEGLWSKDLTPAEHKIRDEEIRREEEESDEDGYG